MEHGVQRPSSIGLSALSHRMMSKLSAATAAAKDDCPAGAGGESSRSGNVVFSPLSIYSALSLAAAGARGRTLSELLDVLGAKSRESLAENVRDMVERALPVTDGQQQQQQGGPRVEYACGLWHDAARTLKPAYRDVAAASCKAVARAVDFFTNPEDARKQINRWVASATNNLIDSILPRGSVDESTSLVVATAIYFKGMWRTPFDKSLTKEGRFQRLDGTAVDAQFMRSNSDQLVATYQGFKVLRMPYAVHDPMVDWMMRLRATGGVVIPRPRPRPAAVPIRILK